jgi:hypothetical protein
MLGYEIPAAARDPFTNAIFERDFLLANTRLKQIYF